MSKAKTITLRTLPAHIKAATTRRALLRLTRLALAEGEASMRYAQHCDLGDAVLAVSEAAQYGQFALAAINKAERAISTL